jgi:hypothetical protein
MGKDFTPLRLNGATQKQIEDVYKRLKTKEVVEATREEWFYKRNLPTSFLIDDIEIGDGRGTKESVVRFKNGEWIVFGGVVKIETILRVK